MLEIKNIHIAFDRVILEKETICIKDGLITGISGINGTGKSSLLYLISRIIKSEGAKFLLNHQEIHPSDTKWRGECLGIVMQNPQFTNLKTIEDHFRMSALLANRDISKEDMYALLKRVRLSQSIKDTTEHLSGGEKQRLSLALALAKQPLLLVLDEPTSALDTEDTQLFLDILRSEVYHNNMMAVIVSHKKRVLDHVDVLYEIRNQHLVLKRDKDSDSKTKARSKRSKKAKPARYYLRHRRHKIQDLIFALFLMVMSCILFFGSAWMKNTEQRNLQMLKTYDSKKVLVKSTSDGLSDYTTWRPIDTELIEVLGQNNEVESINPYYEWHLDTLEIDSVAYEDVLVTTSLSLDHVISNIEGLPDEYVIDLGEDISLKCEKTEYQNNLLSQLFIQLPISIINQDIEIRGLEIIVKFPEHMKDILKTLSTMDPNWLVASQKELGETLQQQLDMVKKFTFPFYLLTVISTVLLEFILLMQWSKNKEKTWGILELSGMPREEILNIHISEIVYNYLISLIFIIGLIMLMNSNKELLLVCISQLYDAMIFALFYLNIRYSKF